MELLSADGHSSAADVWELANQPTPTGAGEWGDR
jgi:hypothetical protein